MLRLGIEEPIRRNDMLSELSGDRLRVAKSLNAYVNRYSSVWISDSQQLLYHYVAELLKEQVRFYWVCTWPTGAYETPARVRWRRLRFNRGGWLTDESCDTVVSVRQATSQEISEFKPEGYIRGDGGIVLVCCENLDLKWLQSSKVVNSLRFMGGNRKFIPAPDFYSWLVDIKGIAVYEVNSASDRYPALIVLSHEKLSLKSLDSIKLKTRFYYNDEAGIALQI